MLDFCQSSNFSVCLIGGACIVVAVAGLAESSPVAQTLSCHRFLGASSEGSRLAVRSQVAAIMRACASCPRSQTPLGQAQRRGVSSGTRPHVPVQLSRARRALLPPPQALFIASSILRSASLGINVPKSLEPQHVSEQVRVPELLVLTTIVSTMK